MSTYDEFYAMALEVLNDPDLRSEAKITYKGEPVIADPTKPWEQTSKPVTRDVYCFYSKLKNAMVNGTVVMTGQKVALIQLAVPEASLMTASWLDGKNKTWVVKQVEPIELNDKVIVYKLLLGV